MTQRHGCFGISALLKSRNTAHIWFGKHYYSVPYRYAGREVDMRASSTLVEVFCDNRRIASHLRSSMGRQGALAAPSETSTRGYTAIAQPGSYETYGTYRTYKS